MARQSDQPILANLLQAVQRLYEGASSGVDDLPTGLPWVSLVRRATPGPRERDFEFGVVRSLLEAPLRDLNEAQREELRSEIRELSQQLRERG